jgi:hypothetical protein
MEKKKYDKPTMRVVSMRHRTKILQGSSEEPKKYRGELD